MSKAIKWNGAWLEKFDHNNDQIKKWCTKESNDCVSCSWCSKNGISIKSGLTNIISHSKSEKHQQISKAKKITTPIDKVWSSDQKATRETLSVKEKAKEAEIRWTIFLLQHNISFDSQSDAVDCLKEMFPDSSIPEHMTLGSDKIKYLTTEAIFVWALNGILKEMKESKLFSIHVDEANKLKQYIGVVFRFLVPGTWNLKVVCLDIQKLSKCDSASITEAILESLKSLKVDLANCVSVMSDNCPVMRGSKKGVFKQLKKKSMPNLVNMDGCSLHRVHNVASYVIQRHFNDLELWLVDLHQFFKYSSTKEEEFSKTKELLETEDLCVLRFVSTRWLQIVPVVERVLLLFDALLEFFTTNTSARARFEKIRSILRHPLTKFKLHLLLEVLKPLRSFELLFQKEQCQIHLLHKEITNILKQWLVRFLKPSAIPNQLTSNINVDDFSQWLPPFEISIGADAKRLMASFSSSDQQACLSTIRGVFLTGTKRLLKTLPFDSSFLRSCQLLSPENKHHSQVETWGKELCKNLCPFIPQVDETLLEVELRLYSSSEVDDVTHDSISEYWSSVEEKQEFPLLCSLMKVAIIIPHGNADIERQFSVLTDIVTKKRGRLSPITIKSLIVTKSIFSSNGWRSSSIPIDDELLKLSTNASKNYRKRLHDEAKEEAERKRRKLEQEFVEKFASFSKADEALSSTDAASKNVDEDIAKLLKEKEKLNEMLALANKKSDDSEAKLKKLLDEKKKLDEKKVKKMKQLLDDYLVKNVPSTSH